MHFVRMNAQPWAGYVCTFAQGMHRECMHSMWHMALSRVNAQRVNYSLSLLGTSPEYVIVQFCNYLHFGLLLIYPFHAPVRIICNPTDIVLFKKGINQIVLFFLFFFFFWGGGGHQMFCTIVTFMYY